MQKKIVRKWQTFFWFPASREDVVAVTFADSRCNSMIFSQNALPFTIWSCITLKQSDSVWFWLYMYTWKVYRSRIKVHYFNSWNSNITDCIQLYFLHFVTSGFFYSTLAFEWVHVNKVKKLTPGDNLLENSHFLWTCSRTTAITCPWHFGKCKKVKVSKRGF